MLVYYECPWLCVGEFMYSHPLPTQLIPFTFFLVPDLHWERGDLSESLPTAAHLWPGVHCQIPGLYLL